MDAKEFKEIFEENGQEAPEGFEEVDNGDWVSEGKYEYKDVVYYSKELNQYFKVNRYRSGSYFTDYDYLGVSVCEVEPHVVEVVEYRVK